LASALESVQDAGSVIYVDHKGFVYDPDGQVVFGQDGNPLRVNTRIVAKLRSLEAIDNLEGIASLEYEIGGRNYYEDLPDSLKHMDACPVPLILRVQGVESASMSPVSPELRRASAEERATILQGLASYAEAEGKAFATKAEAVANGFVKVITATGEEILARVGPTAMIETGVEGAGKVLEATLRTPDGDRKVIAEGETAKVLESAGE
jgi:hypothetical protein